MLFRHVLRMGIISSILVAVVAPEGIRLARASDEDGERVVASLGFYQITSRTTNKRRRGRRRAAAATSIPAGNPNTTTRSQSPPGTQSQLPTSLGPLTGVTYELPIQTPAVGEEQIQGLLTRVDCPTREVVFTVKTMERILKLWTHSLNSVQFRTYTPDVSGEITCGVRNPGNTIIVTFRPTKDNRAKFNGALVALEFVPKNFEFKKR